MDMKFDSENKALGMVLIATLFTGLLGIFSQKLKIDHGLNSYDVALIKFVLSVIVVAIVLYFMDKESLKLKRWQDLGFILFFSLVNVGFTVAIYLAMDTNLGAGLSGAIQNTNVYFTLVLAAIFFGEKITKRKVIAMCIGFVGCIFVVNLFNGEIRADTVGVILSVLSAAGVSVFWLGTKYAGTKGYTPGGTMFWMFLVSSLLLLIPIPGGTDVPHIIEVAFSPSNAWLLMIGAGIISTMIPKYMIIAAYQTADAGKVAVVMSFDMVTSAVYAAIFLGENITPWSYFGILLIIVSIALIELRYFDKFFGEEPKGSGS